MNYKLVIALVIAVKLLMLTTGFAYGESIQPTKYSPADAGVVNKDRILYWLIKRGELAADASASAKQQALNTYLLKKSFQPTVLPKNLAKKVKSAKEFSHQVNEKNVAISGKVSRVSQRSIAPEDVKTTVKVLAILVDFNDLKYNDNGLSINDTDMFYSEYTPEHYTDLLFSPSGYVGPSEQNIESVYQYYQQESGSSFEFEGAVHGWISAKNDAEYYGGNDETTENDENVQALVIEAVTQLVADGVDLSAYDNTDLFDFDGDGNVDEPDGIVDHVMIFHASIGEEAGGGNLAEDAIWSHRHFVYNDAGDDAASIVGSNTKVYGYTINPIDAATGVVVHEFGHDLGLDDEYDIDQSNIGSPVSDWSVMSSGSWLGTPAGTQPSSFSPYARDFLQGRFQGKWIKQQEIEFADLTTETTALVKATNHEGINQIKVNLPPEKIPFGDAYSGDYQYYSQQGDLLDNTLNFNVSLPSGSPELVMQARWDIEEDYDYVQVLVNGEAISGNHTKVSNSVHNQITHYISKKSADINSAQGSLSWVELSFDLSAYQGQSITLSIQYVTDQAVGGYGFVVDDIQVVNQGSSLFTYGGELENEVTLNGFQRITNEIESKPRNYYVQLRNHSDVDAGLEKYDFDPGVLIWYRNDNIIDNRTSAHPGEVFIGVVDADQNTIKSSSNRILSSDVQLRDAAFSLYSQSSTSNDDHLAATRLFSDLDDYSAPSQPESGLILPKLGLTINVASQSSDSATASIEITRGDATYIIAEREGLEISLSVQDDESTTDAIYMWTLGDGTELIGAEVTHQYTSSGSYDVSVTYNTSSGDKVLTTTVVMGEPISAELSYDTVGLKVNFSADVSGGEGVLTYHWNFGDDSDAVLTREAEHEYTAAGTYKVMLSISDETNQVYAFTLEVVTEDILTVSFTHTATNLSVSFIPTVSGGDGTYAYSWDFGDSSTSAAENPSHSYSSAGSYTVVLVATDSTGRTNETSQSITVTAAIVTTPATPSKSSSGGGSLGLGLLALLLLHRKFRGE
jgi:immune inhibitor A